MASPSVPLILPREDRPRTVVGIAFGSGLDRAAAVLASASGYGLDACVRIRRTASRPLSRQPGWESVVNGLCPEGLSLPQLSSDMADQAVTLVREFASLEAFDGVLAAGVHDPGFWHVSNNVPQARINLCDAARLAESTGLTVIDDFPSRDLASGGRGGPLDAVPKWLLLGHPQHPRLVVDLGRTVHMVYLPARQPAANVRWIAARQVGPGMGLLDALTHRLTEGKQAFDPGGRLAVQGQQIPELLEELFSASCYRSDAPGWHPYGVSAEDFVDLAVAAAVKSGWSMRDLLCTATHLVAESIARAVKCHVAGATPVSELVLTGGGQHNGLLLHEIGRRTGSFQRIRVQELGVPSDHLDAACVAVLTLLHLDQVPQTHTAISGCSVPRVLGRLTPGAPKNWLELIRMIHENRPGTMSLRTAI